MCTCCLLVIFKEVYSHCPNHRVPATDSSWCTKCWTMSPCRFTTCWASAAITCLHWMAQSSEELFYYFILFFTLSIFQHHSYPAQFVPYSWAVPFPCVCFSCGWEKNTFWADHEKFKFCGESCVQHSWRFFVIIYLVWPPFFHTSRCHIICVVPSHCPNPHISIPYAAKMCVNVLMCFPDEDTFLLIQILCPQWLIDACYSDSVRLCYAGCLPVPYSIQPSKAPWA